MKKIIAVTVWSSNDPLIKVYTLPYLNLIISMYPTVCYYLQTFEKGSIDPSSNYDMGITYLKSEFSRGIVGKFIQYIRTIVRLVKLAKQEDIVAIHAFCTPGAMIGYIVSKLSGKPLLIDSLEPHAECMVESGTWERNSVYFRLLFLFEKLSIKHAKAAICVTPTMPAYVKERYGIELSNYYYKPACIDLPKFNISKKATEQLKSELGISSEVVCTYVGKFGDLYLEDEVFDFFSVCSNYWNGNFKVLLLTNQSESYLKEKADKYNFPYYSIIKKFVSPSEVPLYLSISSFAISPLKPIPTRKYCTPIKTGEYWAAGLPVVITKDISIDSDIIEQNKIGYVLKSFEATEYINACNAIDKLLQDGHINNKIRCVAERSRSFKLAELAYKGALQYFNIY
jgi:glycosyltransferase involved in cell wall biosynthesis